MATTGPVPDYRTTDAIIEVLDWAPPPDRNSKVRATAVVRLGGVTVRNVRLMEGQRGPWIALPTHKVDDAWEPLVLLSDRLRIAVLAALTEAVYGPPDESESGAPF